jgi:ribosomal protein L30E
MPRPRIHYLHTGPWPWYIGFTTEEAAFQREMKRLRVKDAGPGVKAGSNAATHHLVNGSTNMALIVMHRPSRRASKEQYASLLAHEAVHVVQEMREKLGDLGTEAEAYLVQQIVQEGLQIAWGTGRTVRKEPQA